MMTAAWGGVCCSSPPCVGVSLRKATYSYGAILERKAFTVNIPPAGYVKETDYVGIASGRETDKWQATGLTPVRSDIVDAPYVAQFPLVLECRLVNTLELGLHTRFIGEVMDVKADNSVLGDDGSIDILKVDPFFYIPAVPRKGAYYRIGPYIERAHSVGLELRGREG